MYRDNVHYVGRYVDTGDRLLACGGLGDAVEEVEDDSKVTEDKMTRSRTNGPAGGCKRVIDARHISNRSNWEAAKVLRQTTADQ